MGPEKGRQGLCWREVTEVLQSVGWTEWEVGRELGEPRASTKLLWVPSVGWLGLRQDAMPSPTPCPRLTNPMHCLMTWRQAKTYSN